MSTLAFDAPEVKSIPVKGESSAYPVGRIFCVGRNYAAHAAEMGHQVDREAPFYFTKSALCTTPSGAVTPYPPGTENFHYEMELTVAMGAPAFRVAKDSAMEAVYGYCCGLDMTRRDLQLAERSRQRPWDLGKDVENGAVFAPITRAWAFGVIDDQRIWLSQNGEMKQDATLTELIWKVDEIISHLSRFYHLAPGDLIMTGTPAGVGAVQPGDRLEGGVDGLDAVSLTIGPAE